MPDCGPWRPVSGAGFPGVSEGSRPGGVPGPGLGFAGAPEPPPDRAAVVRSLAEIELQARYEWKLTEVDYYQFSGLMSRREAGRRRRETCALYEAALADLRAYQSQVDGC